MSDHEPLVQQIARAVLYEGYILYPYRPSVKTRQRWTFGGIYPAAFAEADPSGADGSTMQAQCLMDVGGNDVAAAMAALDVSVRFLHLTSRTVQTPDKRPVESIEMDGRTFRAWQEAEEREVRIDALSIKELVQSPRHQDFAFDARCAVETLQDAAGETVGRLVRSQQAIRGTLDVSADVIGGGVCRVTVRVSNHTPFGPHLSRDDAVVRSLASSHIVLCASEGAFVSMTDPAPVRRDAVEACQNIGCWPVLVGEDGARDTMLCSPIILPDYPQLAPESPGDLFDGTEIDEILTLRILTLTDAEKREAASIDPRAGAMLARTEALAREQLMNLHGTVRGLREVAPEAPEPQGVAHG